MSPVHQNKANIVKANPQSVRLDYNEKGLPSVDFMLETPLHQITVKLRVEKYPKADDLHFIIK